MDKNLKMPDMVEKLRPILASKEANHNFSMPSFLEEVPSYTSIDSVPNEKALSYAKFWRRPE